MKNLTECLQESLNEGWQKRPNLDPQVVSDEMILHEKIVDFIMKYVNDKYNVEFEKQNKVETVEIDQLTFKKTIYVTSIPVSDDYNAKDLNRESGVFFNSIVRDVNKILPDDGKYCGWSFSESGRGIRAFKFISSECFSLQDGCMYYIKNKQTKNKELIIEVYRFELKD